jgi:DNA-binding GntR family transcriptional regulator
LLFPAIERMLPRLEQAGARLLEAHGRIIDALKAGDARVAGDWMRRHIKDFRRGYILAGFDPSDPVRFVAIDNGGARAL